MKVEPTPDLALARARLAVLAAGDVDWPVGEGVEIGPPGYQWWPCVQGTGLALSWFWGEEGLRDAAAILDEYGARWSALTIEGVRAGLAYCERNVALFEAKDWLDAMGNDEFPIEDQDEALRADVAAVLAALVGAGAS